MSRRRRGGEAAAAGVDASQRNDLERVGGRVAAPAFELFSATRHAGAGTRPPTMEIASMAFAGCHIADASLTTKERALLATGLRYWLRACDSAQ